MYNTKVETQEGYFNSLQVASMGNITGANFSVLRLNSEAKQAFLIKNDTEDNVQLTVTLVSGDQVTTTFYPGWNPELVIIVQDEVEGLKYGY